MRAAVDVVEVGGMVCAGVGEVRANTLLLQDFPDAFAVGNHPAFAVWALHFSVLAPKPIGDDLKLFVAFRKIS
jgi:hypothetical protein